MTSFSLSPKTHVKSSNNILKIELNYLYTLIMLIVYFLAYYLITKNYTIAMSIIKTTAVTFSSAIILNYIIKLITKNKSKFIPSPISLSLIITLFSYKYSLIISIIAVFITIVISNIDKHNFLFTALYGVLFLFLYKYYQEGFSTILNHTENITNNTKLLVALFSPEYLTPALTFISFIYLFNKKSIKYPFVLSYITIYLIVILSLALLHHENIINILFKSYSLNSLLFLSIYCLSDSYKSPTIASSQIVYGLVLGLLTGISTHYINLLPIVVIPLIMSNLFLKYFDNLTINLKYKKNYFKRTIYLIIFLLILSITIIYLLK